MSSSNQGQDAPLAYALSSCMLQSYVQAPTDGANRPLPIKLTWMVGVFFFFSWPGASFPGRVMRLFCGDAAPSKEPSILYLERCS